MNYEQNRGEPIDLQVTTSGSIRNDNATVFAQDSLIVAYDQAFSVPNFSLASRLNPGLVGLQLVSGPPGTTARALIVDGADSISFASAVLERATHTLKSTAGNLGAVQLQQTAQQMESMAADGSIDNEVARKLEAQYEQTVTALQKILGELEP